MRKKLLASLITVSAVLALGVCAWAGTTMENIGTIDFADEWIDGTNLLEKPDGSGLYVLSDMDGNTLSEKSYGRIGYDSGYGFISVQVEPDDGINGIGAVNLSGKEIVPCSYGKVDFENEHWIRAIALKESTADQYDYESWIGDGYYLIDHADFYYVDDEGNAALASSLSRDIYMDSNAYGRFINIENRADGSITAYDGSWAVVETPEPLKYLSDEAPGADEKINSYYENGQYGLKDAAGNVIIGPTYGYIENFKGEYAEVENRLESGDVKGLIDKTGAVIVPVEYDDVDYGYYAPATPENNYSNYSYNNFGYFAVEKDNKLGYVDMAGNLTCDFTIAESNCDVYGASAIYTDMGGAKHILAADGTDTDVSQYESIYALNSGSGMYYKVCDSDDNYGVIDWHGDGIAEVKYNDVDLSGDGQYLLLQEEYNSPCELVKLTYTADSAPAAPAEDTGASLTVAEEGGEGEAAPAEGGADSADLSSIKGLIDSAITLANTDAAANKDAIIGILTSAATSLAESKPEVKAVLDSAISMMNSDAVDGASVATILNSVKTLLG